MGKHSQGTGGLIRWYITVRWCVMNFSFFPSARNGSFPLFFNCPSRISTWIQGRLFCRPLNCIWVIALTLPFSVYNNRPFRSNLRTLLTPCDRLPRGVKWLCDQIRSGTQYSGKTCMMVAMLVALHFSSGSQRIPDAIYDGFCGPGGCAPYCHIFTLTPTPPSPEIVFPFTLPAMNSPSVLQRLASDAPRTFYHISDLAFDEDHEIFIHLGGWRHSAAHTGGKTPLQGFWVSSRGSYGL